MSYREEQEKKEEEPSKDAGWATLFAYGFVVLLLAFMFMGLAKLWQVWGL